MLENQQEHGCNAFLSFFQNAMSFDSIVIK